MGKRTAKYETRTESAVKEALMRLLAKKPLAEISIAELSREAHVSRSTFYGHYGNVVDVYDELVDEISGEMSPILSQVTCQDGFRASGKPFCSLVRDEGKYGSIVGDARFADALLSQGKTQEGHDLFALLIEAGYTADEAKAVCSFQMSGCLTAARSANAGEAEWAKIRAVIDRFILGGIAACLAAKRG